MRLSDLIESYYSNLTDQVETDSDKTGRANIGVQTPYLKRSFDLIDPVYHKNLPIFYIDITFSLYRLNKQKLMKL